MKKFIRWAFLQNVWLWLHIFAGGVAAKILSFYLNTQLVMIIVLAAALVWELGELLYILITEQGPYESLEHFFADAAGDIIGAAGMAAVVVV